LTTALAKGDSRRAGVVKETARQVLSSILPERKD
jgi:hypothetical protein